jgi:DNA mismatch repair protein MutS
LAKDFERIKNFHVTVKDIDNKIIFVRKLAEGGSEHSFGIHVAQMAGMPQEIVLRADEIMRLLEENRSPTQTDAKDQTRKKLKEMPKKNYQLSFFDPVDPEAEKIKDLLRKLDVNALSPIEALLKLNELKGML